MTKTGFATAFGLALALPSLSQAADFAGVDTNEDGYITMSEFQAAMPDTPTDAFTAADANADGALSQEEFSSAQAAGTLPSSEG